MKEIKEDLIELLEFPDKEKIIIIKSYNDLILNCKNCLTDQDKLLLKKALIFSSQVHKNQYISKGKPYLLHPLNVSKIVSDEIGLGVNSMVSAFLHEIYDKGEIDEKQIIKEFGKTINSIVQGLSKISGLDFRNTAIHAENFRKLILTMASDIRVILIKIADRLHNMRTLDTKTPERQFKMALETSYLYAPLAHRIGMYNIKSELEDISLKYLDKETYNYIDQKLKDTKLKRERYIREFIKPIKTNLEKEGIKFEIKRRTKSISSIWNKMKKQDVDFDGIFDIYAIRIILESSIEKEKETCWKVYSIVSDIYQPNPQRLRDWISLPKSNGYESLHTTVLGPRGKWVEVQIRTTRMDEIAEKGLAAHWKYKEIKDSNRALEDWLSKMRELLETPESSQYEFIDNIKLNLYTDEIFVFTPNGDIKKLPVNSSVLDFAYEIHSDIGNKCIGAKINNRNVGIKEIIKNGDQVEIITSKNQKPNLGWLNYVITSKAKSKIKAALREEKLYEAELGKEIIKRRLKNWKIKYSDEVINKLLKYYKIANSTDLYYLISKEKIDLTKVKEIITTKKEIEKTKQETDKIQEVNDLKIDSYNFLTSDYLIIEDKIKGIDYKLSPCCNPIFGDNIFGFVTITEGIKIHRYTCPNAALLLTKYPYRVVKAKWTRTENIKAFQTVIKISGINESGILSQISDLISKDTKVTLRSINVNNNEGAFEGIIKVYVHDKQHLDALIKKLIKIKGINKAIRLNN